MVAVAVLMGLVPPWWHAGDMEIDTDIQMTALLQMETYRHKKL
jgi:hypothetical protein